MILVAYSVTLAQRTGGGGGSCGDGGGGGGGSGGGGGGSVRFQAPSTAVPTSCASWGSASSLRSSALLLVISTGL